MSVGLLVPAWYDVLWTLVVLPVLVLPLAAVVWVVVRLVRGPVAPAPTAAARAAHRHATAVSTLAWVALAITLLGGAAVVAHTPLSLGQGLAFGLVPAAAGLSLAAVQAIGELTWPRPTGTVRRAGLVPRSAADVAPAALRRALWSWGALLGTLLLACGLTAADDGRSVARSFEDGSSAAGPFPGWFYALPLLVATAVVLLSAEGTLRLVTRRASVSDAEPTWDLALRRLSAHRLLRGAQLVLGLTTAGVTLVAGTALRNVGSSAGAPGSSSPVHVALGTGLMTLAVGALLATLVLAALPAPGPDAAAGPRTALPPGAPPPHGAPDRAVGPAR
ncbi:hypothetical protein GXB85_01915 [Cellulomonas sp. APG4]|uniref:hypothetical protein n=1 Tax=Cellulomonas sp. APG4 TaxID=1538656 RepID=UPI00137B3B45|nr:hypothetical protein [Cellulomonas sp. APG4]NCT89716.1 hypothetical protein [Cellulomonas sp. APG4]